MVIVPVVLAALGVCAGAQAPLAEDRLRMPAGLPPAVDVVAADLDGDGLLDLARAAEGTLTLLFQQPSGSFALNPAQAPLAFPSPVRSVVLARLRANVSRPDLVVTMQSGPPVLLWNNGQGGFSRAPVTLPPTTGLNLFTLAVDFDRSAPDDLLLFPEQGRPQLLLAQAGVGYSDASGLLGPALFVQSPRAIAVDLDRDGDDDFVVASAVASQPFVLENNTTTVRTVPLPLRGSYSAVASGDFNLDGRPDLVMARTAPVGLDFALNLATGFVAYSPVTPLTPLSDVRALRAVDLASDGSPDLVLLLADGRLLLGVHDGRPAFQFSPFSPPLDQGPRAAFVATDLDNDTDVDFVVVGARSTDAGLRDAILLGDAQATSWVDTESIAVPSGVVLGSGALATLDVDADAEPDLVAYGAAGRGLAYRNDGAARFREVTSLMPNLATRDVVELLPIAVSGAERRDLLVVSSAAGGAAQPPGIRLLIAPPAAGAYTDGTARLPTSVNQGFRDVVLVQANAGQPAGFAAVDATNHLHVYQPLAGAVNEIPGAFSPAVAAGPVRRALSADVDGDLRDDLVLLEDGAVSTQIEVYLRTNSAAPLFRVAGSPIALPSVATDAVLADFDGDARADLVATLDAAASVPLVFFAGGVGGALLDLTAARFSQPVPAGYDVLAMLPTRGRPRSLLLGSSSGGALVFLRGQGPAPFSAPEAIDVHGAPPVARLSIADFDGDGDADCAVEPRLGRPALLLGTALHCATAGVTQAGRQMVLRLRATTPGSIAAWLWSPAGPARVDVPPYGLLRLAPPVVSLLVLPIGASLVQDVALPIPPASALATLYFQAAVFDPADFSVRLTNLEPALILAR